MVHTLTLIFLAFNLANLIKEVEERKKASNGQWARECHACLARATLGSGQLPAYPDGVCYLMERGGGNALSPYVP